MARIKQILDKSDLPAEYQPVFERVTQSRPHGGGPFSILFHSPAVADKVDALAAALRGNSELSPQQFVTAVLAVARAKDCLFVWSVQAPNARRAGVTEETISAIRDRQPAGLDADTAALVSFAQQISAGNRVDQATFDALESRHGARWLVELTTLAGHFGLICGINNAFEVAPAPDGDKLPV